MSSAPGAGTFAGFGAEDRNEVEGIGPADACADVADAQGRDTQQALRFGEA